MSENCFYNGVAVGDYAWLIPSTQMPDTTVHIPRAQGVRQRDMGGGMQILTVKAWVVKSTTIELAQYFEGLARSFGTGLGSLVIDSVTFTNCKLLSIDPQDQFQGVADHFVCVFRKTAATQ